jgi:acyl carrier protein
MKDLKKYAFLEEKMENKIIFIKELEKILEKINLDESFILTQCELWDSLSIISTIGLIDQIFNVTVTGDNLIRCNTIKDIFYLFEYKN